MKIRLAGIAPAILLLATLPFGSPEAAPNPPGTAPAPVRTDTARAGHASTAPRLDLEGLLEKFDAAQSGIRTLMADFTESKQVALLREPVISKGKFFYTNPNDVLWEYLDPTPRIFLIRREELLAYYPIEKRAEQLGIKRYHSRLLKVLGIGQVSKDLMKYYEVSLDPSSSAAGNYELVLSPRKRIVKKRISEVRIWVDEKTFLPVQMRYEEDDGDLTTISFKDIQLNKTIDEAIYRIDLPDDVKVERTFTGLGSNKNAS